MLLLGEHVHEGWRHVGILIHSCHCHSARSKPRGHVVEIVHVGRCHKIVLVDTVHVKSVRLDHV